MMRKFKKFVGVFCSIAILATMSVSAFATSTSSKLAYTVESKFTDVKPSDWFFEAVAKCEDLGLVGGYGDGNFGPNDPVTVEQVALISMRAIQINKTGIADKIGVTIVDERGFRSQLSQVIITSTNWGLINDAENNHERFIKNCLREEALSCFYRAYNYTNFEEWLDWYTGEVGTKNKIIENPNIPDYNDISDIYKSDIYEAYKLGFATGYDETGAFKPKNEITRAEFCQMIYNSGIVEMEHYKISQGY